MYDSVGYLSMANPFGHVSLAYLKEWRHDMFHRIKSALFITAVILRAISWVGPRRRGTS